MCNRVCEYDNMLSVLLTEVLVNYILLFPAIFNYLTHLDMIVRRLHRTSNTFY